MDDTLFDLTHPATWAFVAIPVLLVAALACGVAVGSSRLGERGAAGRRAAFIVVAGAAWMIATWVLAARGVFRQWDTMPAPFGLLIIAIVGLACLITFDSSGRQLALGVPLWALVAVQGFRLPLELAMHEMYVRGVMPEQMTYTGRNFDIVTGITALIVGALLWAGRCPRWLVAMWNVMGLALLLNVMVVAILSTPRFAYFGSTPDRLNVWVTYPPYVWLPAVMVLAALAGHLVIFRALATAPRPRG
jgi:hypothetical protein